MSWTEVPCESLQPAAPCPSPPTTCFSRTWPPNISSSTIWPTSKSNACLYLLPRLPAIYYHIQARGWKMFGELERGCHFWEEKCWDLLTQNVTDNISSIYINIDSYPGCLADYFAGRTCPFWEPSSCWTQSSENASGKPLKDNVPTTHNFCTDPNALSTKKNISRNSKWIHISPANTLSGHSPSFQW